MKRFQKFVIGFAVVVTLLLPHVLMAAGNNNTSNTNTPKSSTSATCEELKRQLDRAGGSDITETIPQHCSVEGLYVKFINVALGAAGVFAVIAIIYGGYLYMSARGNDQQVKTGRSVLTWAIIGLIVILAAATIVNVIVSALVENRFV